LAFLALFASFVAAGEAERPAPDPKAMRKRVDELIAIWKDNARNQDVQPSRRRRDVARELGEYPIPASIGALVTILEQDKDVRAQIHAMQSIGKIGDFDAVRRMVGFVQRENRMALTSQLGDALALTKVPEVGPWLVERVLPTPSDDVRLACVEALGSLGVAEARAPLLALLERERKRPRPDFHLYYELLRALGRIGGPGADEAVFEAAAAADWRLRLAAAEVLLRQEPREPVVERMRALLRDAEPIVRETAALAVAEAKAEAFVPDLVLLMREGNLRGKERAHRALCAISGKDFKFAPELWERWWTDKREGRAGGGTTAPDETISVATYFDFKIYSDRVLFVVDTSGSMAWPDYRNNRIETATKELFKVLRSLSERTYFNVMTFAGHVDIWQRGGEVLATKENVASAIDWAKSRLLPRGGTNTYEALTVAFEKNPRVDTIYFLSDGIPSTGKLEVPEEILAHVRRLNRFRKVTIHTIALVIGRPSIEKAVKYEDPDEMADFMRALAEQNGGACLDIRRPKPLGEE